MSKYDYKCIECGKIFEISTLKMTSKEDRNPVCPNCGNKEKSTLEFIFPQTPFQLKGQGWSNESYSSTIDPTTVSGVTQIEKPTKRDGILHKKKKPRKW